MSREEALRAFGDRHRLGVLLAGAHGVGSPDLWSRVVDRMEEAQLLARQADRPGGFETAARRLEAYVLPALIELGEWPRFLRHMATAIRLRRVAELLDEPLVLQALVRGGREDLAEAAVGQLSDPADRVDAWAAMALVESSESSRFADWVGRIRTTVDTALDSFDGADRDEVTRWRDALASVGRSLALALRARWRPWISHLDSWREGADEVRLAVADGFFSAGEPHAPELWEILATVESPERLRGFLPEAVARAVVVFDPRVWWSTIRDRLGGAQATPELLWAVGIRLFGRRSEAPAQDWAWLLERLPPPPWSAELIEGGGGWWSRLPAGLLDELGRGLPGREDEARLWTVVLEIRRDAGSRQKALSLLSRLPVTPETTALHLRVARATPAWARSEGASEAGRALHRLHRIGFALPTEDLCRAVDLVARDLPHRLKATLDRALTAAPSGPETLRVLAASSDEPTVWHELFGGGDRYAATVAANAAEGFRLRAEVLIRLACRRAVAERDLAAVREAAERLLPAEEDRLRSAAADALGRTAPRLAAELCDGIRDPRLRLRTWLGVAATTEGPLREIAPTALYAASARSEPLEDELRALALQLAPPEHESEAGAGISGTARRTQALIDGAWHRLKYQDRAIDLRFRDPASALTPLREALGVVVSDAWLVALTPELVALGARRGSREAFAECQEAVFRIVGAATVPWARREEALLTILRRVLAPVGRAGELLDRRRRAALIVWLARLPGRMTRTPGAADLRHAWHRLLPVLVSWAELLGEEAPGTVRPALREAARQAIDWRPGHQAVFRLCAASGADRRVRAERMAVEDGAEGDTSRAETVRALGWLLAVPAPRRLLPLLRTLPPRPVRERTVVELVRHGPFPERFARSLLPLLAPGHPCSAKAIVHLGLRAPGRVCDEEWVAAFAALLSRDAIDPDDPSASPMLRRLWTLRDDASLTPIARAAVAALMRGGPSGGERALRVFLAAWVRPSLGVEGAPESHRRHREASVALARARSLDQTVDPAIDLGLDHPPQRRLPVERNLGARP